MSLYVEVMCDVRDETPWPNSSNFRCRTHANHNPQGHDPASARKEAKVQKWKLKGDYAVCPGCQLTTAGKQFIENNFN